MDIRRLSRIDLNLLVAFQVLLEERNVSRAAARLFVTQPAMSKTLARLRDTFDDPLFIRTAHGIEPTPRALQLQQLLGPVLEGAQQLMEPAEFDPATWQGEFVIAITETAGVTLLPPLMERLQREARGVRIKTLTRVEHQLEQLAAGNLDFAVHMRQSHYSDEFDVTELTSANAVALVRKGHPLIGNEVNFEALLKYPNIRLYIPDFDDIEIVRRTGLTRQQMIDASTPFETSHLMTALAVVRRTDCILMLPPFIRHKSLIGEAIEIIDVPSMGSNIDYLLVSHRRVTNSPPHQWLRACIENTVAELKATRT